MPNLKGIIWSLLRMKGEDKSGVRGERLGVRRRAEVFSNINQKIVLKNNKMKRVKNIISVFLFASLSVISFAQPIPSEEVEIIKDFEAALEESNKLQISPELPPLDSTSRSLVYTIPTKTINVEYLPPKIRPIAMRKDEIPPIYKGYLKLGYGIPSSPYGELSYHHAEPDNFEVGLNALYHSANFKDLENQRFSNLDLGVDGTYYNDQGFAVSGNIGYDVNEVHFYGYDHDEQTYAREQIRQEFRTFTLGAKIFNGARTEGDINYFAGFDLYRLDDNYASDETTMDIKLGVTKWFNEQHELTVGITTDFTTYDDQLEKNKLNNFYLMPNFTFHGDAFKVKVGINLTSNDDKFKVFPDAEAAVNIVGNKLSVFAGAEGSLYKNSFKNLSDYNPYIVSRTRLMVMNSSYNNFYGGIRGNLKVVDYQGQVGLKKVNDLALYLADPVDTLRFAVLYDTVDVFYIKGTLNATPVKGLELIGTIGSNVYSLNNQEKAWHLPALEVNVGLAYTTLEDKLRLRADLFVENGVPYINDIGETDNLNGLFDLSLGADYQLAKNFGMFFQLNNLASNKRQRWANYPTYGINILGGITARF